MKTLTNIKVNEHVSLRQYTAADAPVLFELVEKNRAHLAKRLTWLHEYTTLADIQRFIETAAEVAQTNGAPTCGIWYDGQLIGTISFHPINHDNQTALFGYWIDADMQGRGIITTCVRAMADYAFSQLGVEHVEIVCAPDNKASQAIATKLGFRRESEAQVAVWKRDPTAQMVVFMLDKPGV